MANRGKAEFLKDFGASLAAYGYRQVQTGIFRKPADDFEYQTQLSFSGRVAITANVDTGFWIEAVERWGDECPPIQQQRRSGSKNLATVFGSISLVAGWAGSKINREIDLDSDWDPQIKSTMVAIKAIENRFRNLEDVADFAVNEPNIPLGHHAYRVPVLLQRMQKAAEFERYVERVEGTNFIPNYCNYISTLR